MFGINRLKNQVQCLQLQSNNLERELKYVSENPPKFLVGQKTKYGECVSNAICIKKQFNHINRDVYNHSVEVVYDTVYTRKIYIYKRGSNNYN